MDTNKSSKLRATLEAKGYRFYAGYVDEAGIFHFEGRPDLDAHIIDLSRMHYIKVPGGIMEPPKANPLHIIGGLALGALAFWGIGELTKRLEPPQPA